MNADCLELYRAAGVVCLITPLPWTAAAGGAPPWEIDEPDQRRWDFRHPVVRWRETSRFPIGLGVKLAEAAYYAHPAWLFRNVWNALTGRNVLLPSALFSLGLVYLTTCWDFWSIYRQRHRNSTAQSLAQPVRVRSKATTG